MERITSHQVSDLMEAYKSVYAPQEEITEEQIWEEVHTWVNSLVEEGYDLSEYTWEEMYEHYLNEAPVTIGPGGFNVGGRPVRQQMSPIFQRPGSSGLSIGPGGFNINGRPVRQQMSPIFQRPGATAQRPVASPQRSGTPTQRPATTQRPVASPQRSGTPTQRPATTQKPQVTAAARPAPSSLSYSGVTNIKPITAYTNTPTTQTRSYNPLMQRTFGYQTGQAPDQTAAKSKTLKQDFDVFDVIKGHLLDEGYADTEEAALQIMANMSEEWKESIVEATQSKMGNPVTDALPWNRNTKYTTQGKERKPGENVHGQQTGVKPNTTTSKMGAK